MRLGAQLFTVRELCKTTEGLSETLARVADIGYTEVQLSGVCAYDPVWMREELKKNGLTCPLTHFNADAILADPAGVARDHKAYGCSNVGIGIMPRADFSPEALDAFVANFVPAAQVLKERGCKLFYHNHYHEFWRMENGEYIIERLMRDFPADLMGITFDTYWAQYAGADPAAWLERLAGRVECIHLKDKTMAGEEHHFAPVGHGNMNFPRILAAAEAAGTAHLLVEQDDCYGEDPLVCLKKSYDYLTSLGLA